MSQASALPFDTERHQVAQGCQVLAARGLAPGFLGHISLRIDDDRLLMRSRGKDERGLAATTAADIRLVTFAGEAAQAGELDDYRLPYEFPLHTAVLQARPDVKAVVHAHPVDVVVAELAGLEFAPLVGAYDIPAAAIAAAGIPVFDSAALIATDELGQQLADALGASPVVIMHGHGLTATGSSVAEAVLAAQAVNTIASLALAVAQAGGRPRAISAADQRLLPDLGQGLNTQTAWRHELYRLQSRPRDE